MDDSPQNVLSRFDLLESALIDASSIIYMEKAGFLKDLSDGIKLFAPPQVLAETGLAILGIRQVEATLPSGSTDEQLIACARHLGKAVISEDKKILMALKEGGLPFYNALMMLNYLLYKRRISLKDHSKYFKRLEKIAWYSPRILGFGKDLFAAVQNHHEKNQPP